MLDSESISALIQRCELEDFTPNSAGQIENNYLSDFVDQEIEGIKSIALEEVAESIVQKSEFEIRRVTESSYPRNIMLFHSVGHACLTYLIGPKHLTQLDAVLARLVKAIFENYQAITISLMSNTHIGILTSVRVLYEAYIEFMYIRKHPEVAQDFEVHAKFSKLTLLKNIGGTLTSDDETQLSELRATYGKGFEDNYGWTIAAIPNPADRKLGKLVSELGLEGYNYLYRIACHYVHPSSFSVIFDTLVDGPLLEGVLDSSVELLTNAIVHLMKDLHVEEKARIIIMNVLYGLREDCFPGFSASAEPSNI